MFTEWPGADILNSGWDPLDSLAHCSDTYKTEEKRQESEWSINAQNEKVNEVWQVRKLFERNQGVEVL